MSFVGVAAVAMAMMMADRAKAKEILVIGDSWATVGSAEFEKMATDHGMSVENIAVGGSTAHQWAQSDKLLLVFETLTANPDCKHIWLTVGGNDVLNGLSNGLDMNAIIDKLRDDTMAILGPIFKYKANVSVFQFGYDIPNYDHNRDCLFKAVRLAPSCWKDWGGVPQNGWTDFMSCSNGQTTRLQYDYVDWIGEQAKTKKWDYNALDLLGTFQFFGGVPKSDIGKPNMQFYSPTKYWLDDCTHCNSEGYTLLFHILWEMYFKSYQNNMPYQGKVITDTPNISASSWF